MVRIIEKKLQKEDKLVIQSIHFSFSKEEGEVDFEDVLNDLAKVLKAHPEWRILIEGHTDSLGTEIYNQDISKRRAIAIKGYLSKIGVNPTQLIDAVGMGQSRPVADNETSAGRYKNRRVEIKLIK